MARGASRRAARTPLLTALVCVAVLHWFWETHPAPARPSPPLRLGKSTAGAATAVSQPRPAPPALPVAAPAPPPSVPSPVPPPTRFLHLVSADEGLSGWIDCVREASAAAAALNRVLVEPCVYNSILVPCAAGRTRNIPPHENVPESKFSRPDTDACSSEQWNPESLFPVSALFDWESLQAELHSPIIRFHDWEALRVAPVDDPTAAGKLPLRCTNGRCVVVPDTPLLHHEGNGGGGKMVANWGFLFNVQLTNTTGINMSLPAHDIAARASQGPWAEAADVFVKHWKRMVWKWHTFDPRPLPRFHAAHYRAVREWVQRDVRAGHADPRYAVMQWRAGNLFYGKFMAGFVEKCPKQLLDAADRSWGDSLTPIGAGPSRFVLISDLPSPQNKCPVWDLVEGPQSELRRNLTSIVQRFATKGFRKYDDDVAGLHARLETGVGTVRDLILAAEATWYYTCNAFTGKGGATPTRTASVTPAGAGTPTATWSAKSTPVHLDADCSCFYGSGFVGEAVLLRNLAGRPSSMNPALWHFERPPST